MSYFARTTALSALLGVAMLASPLSAMAADSVAPATPAPATPAPATPMAAAPKAATPEAPRETVDQRIATLHASLNITPSEETDWSGVTKAMRDSAGAMEKLAAERSSKGAANMTALDDLRTYEKFAQAHAEGLRKLTASFAKLYKSMPDAQKKVADQVFQDFGHGRPAAHS